MRKRPFRYFKLNVWMYKIIAIILLISCFFVCIFSTRALAVNPEPGQAGFIALSQYMMPTEIPGVYKVTLSVDPTSKPTLTDIVIVINEGHDASRRNILNNLGGLSAPFGYKLSTNGDQTTTLRKGQATGYTIYDAELFSAEQIIRKLADPLINPNYENTRIAMVSYGAGGNVYKVLNRSGLIRLNDPANVKFLLSRIGILDQQTYGVGVNPVPLAKSTQQAYQILEDPSEQLFFTFPSTGFNTGDNNLIYPNGITIPGSLTSGAWQPPDGMSITDFSTVNKYIVSLHCIGASMPMGNINATLYPLKKPSSPTNINIDAGGSLPTDQQESAYDFPAYDAARYAIKTVSDKLQGDQPEKVFHSFTFWVNPANIADQNAFAWLDFNQTISAFPLSSAPLIPGSGYTPPTLTRDSMLYNRFVSASSGRTYENWEGIQYWSDAAETHNIRDYSDFDPELSKLVEQMSTYAKDTVAYGTLQERFEVYDYPGSERFSIYVTPDTYPVHDGGTVDYKNKNLTWKIGNLPEKGSLTLSFYVSFDTTDTSEDLVYLFSNAKFDYNFGRGVEYKSFPNVYTKGKQVINEDISLNPNESVSLNSEDNLISSESSGSDGNSFVLGMNIFETPMPVYTPSVTLTPKPKSKPKPKTIKDETVEDPTIEMPLTGGTRIILLVVINGVLVLTAFIIRKKLKTKKRPK